MLELIKGRHRLTILPETGGAIGQWQVDGHDLLQPVVTPSLMAQKGVAVGGYPMIPYVNRVADGDFSFAGHEYHLSPNMAGCAHPIHGNAWENVWRVLHKSDTHAVLVFDHVPADHKDGSSDCHWPFSYRSVLSYALRDDMLDINMAVENRDKTDQPIGFGFHPFFAAEESSSLSFNSEKVWKTDNEGLPLKDIPCEGEWSFEKESPIFNRDIDNCFSVFDGQAAVYHSGKTMPNIEIKVDPIFKHLIVFTQSGGNFIAIEPATNMTNALNRPDEAHRQIHVVKPGKRIGGNIRFRPFLSSVR